MFEPIYYESNGSYILGIIDKKLTRMINQLGLDCR
jgi:hypothetical protein